MLQETEYQIEIRRLRDKIDSLVAENYWLKEQLKPLPLPFLSRRLSLTVKETEFLGLILARAPTVVSREMLYISMYAHTGPEIEIKIFDVFICKIRAKLRTYGLDPYIIQTVWGRGWLIEEPGLTILKSLDKQEPS